MMTGQSRDGNATNDPYGPFKVIFDEADGIEKFLEDQERIDKLVAESESDESAQRGRWLLHNIVNSKNPKSGNGLRQILMKMPPECRDQISRVLFKLSSQELLQLNDAALGREAKVVFNQKTLDTTGWLPDWQPIHVVAEECANRFLRGCQQA